ncbi:MAG TPA: DUF916 domain-containing protein, partial [Rugosimonospora sp.]|nr:DUF916 domain-containing protein [Rugosimonospora sp.]
MRRRAALLPAALVAATLLVQAAFLVPATPAAADDAVWSVAPATASGQAARDYFRYALAPGAQVTDQVRVSNLGSAPLTFAVYATDAYTTDDGSFALLTAADKPRDVGTWIVLGARAYTVAPGTYLDIPFRLAVPTNASPGDHVGGVIASVVSQQVTGDGQQVNV